MCIDFELTICVSVFLRWRDGFLSKTVKAVGKPILIHYLTQLVIQMDKFWENFECSSARTILPLFLG